MAKGIRSYGPGKFNTILDSYIYEVSLNGPDEEVGNSQDFGYYALLVGDLLEPVQDIAKSNNDKLTAEEVTRLKESAGVILVESDQGFVGVGYYPTKKALEADWKNVQEDAEEFYKEVEQD